MQTIASTFAATSDTDRTDYAAMSEALARLQHAAAGSAPEAVAALSANDRAKLAVYCYGRAHLNAVGLAIAAQCELDHLVAAAPSPVAGRTLYEQSRDAAARAGKPISRRAPISLAASAAIS